MGQLETFYAVVAGVAGGLFALMFTAIQVREKVWLDESRPLRRVWSVAALAEFLVVVLVALMALTPLRPIHLAPVIGGLGGLATVGWQWRSYCDEDIHDDFEAPRLLCRPYAGCDSRLRAA